MGISEIRIKDRIRLYGDTISLDTPVGEEDSLLQDFVPDESKQEQAKIYGKIGDSHIGLQQD